MYRHLRIFDLLGCKKNGGFLLPWAACFFLGFLFFPFLAQALDPKIAELSRDSLVDVRPPEVTLEKLPNGMVLYLLEDHDLPIFEAFAFVRGGSVEDPADRLGLASLMGTVLRTGGTTHQTVDKIDRFLDDRGAQISTGMTREYGTASLACLSQDLDKVLPLFFEILSSPRFDEKQIQAARLREIEYLKRINDHSEKIAIREFPKLLYGNDSPWARVPDASTLQKISRQDLIHFHQKNYHPDQLILAVTGDFNKEELLKLIRQSTENWPSSELASSSLPAVQKDWQGGVFAVDKPGVQSTVVVGHFGEKRMNPDKFALLLMNEMLGGDIFSSRLGEEVRSSRGLAYSVYSHFGFETDYGLFSAVAQTRSEATGEVIGLIRKVILDFQQGNGLSERELRFVKESTLNQMTGGWEPSFQYVKERARLHFYGYPEDYLTQFRRSIQDVTLSQVKDVARRYLFPDKLKVLVVGDLKKVEEDLKKMGDLKVISLDSK